LSHSLIPDFDGQDDRFAAAFTILLEAIKQRAFPAASIAVTQAGKLVALKSFGTFVYQDAMVAPLLPGVGRSGDFASSNTTVAPNTMFDLASLTKVVATTTMAMILYERGLLELDAPVIGTLPDFLRDATGNSDPRRREVTFRMLLAHSSGLPAYEKLYLKATTREELLNAAFAMPLTSDPGTHTEYSDIGFLVLGAALERMAEESLDSFCQREILGPLAMANITFNPPRDLRPTIPPTADERSESGTDSSAREMLSSESPQKPRSTFRNRIIQGEVQDENAYVLGGVAPHAGLFSTAQDVAIFANAILQCGAGASAREMRAPDDKPSESKKDVDVPQIIRPETVSLFTRRDTTPGTSRALGWDTPSSPSQSGKYFGPNSYGHLGYTGTSLWIDPDRELSITLLTNRTWPDCSNQAIKQVRPRFHDAIIEALEKMR
jgi:CubicO group peptidase (beta-lactamase class C family)